MADRELYVDARPQATVAASPQGASLVAGASGGEADGETGGASGLLERVVSQAAGKPRPPAALLDKFLSEPSPARALRQWLGADPAALDRQQLVRRLNRDVALIDRLLNQQLNAVLHQPAFQRLEAVWRGLEHLVERADEEADRAVKVKVLHATWAELERDFDRAVEFDQSQLFRKVYEYEFGIAGGEPFNALIVDHEVRPRPSAAYPHDDIAVLTSLSQVCAAAFCPLIASVSPAMFGLDDFAGLQLELNHDRTFEQLEYLKWRSLRDGEDARFVALALPRVLMRRPYEYDGERVDGFSFREEVSAPDGRGYLWGSAAFALGGVLLRAFSRSGWPNDICGVERGSDRGGLVTGLPIDSFRTDPAGREPKPITDVVITDSLERQLSELGFVSLCHLQGAGNAAVFSWPSIQNPKTYDRTPATVNARISSRMQYMLGVSRFAHYVKILGRDKIGSFDEGDQMERYLHNWLMRYATPDANISPENRARFPLREAAVQVRPLPGKPGAYQCVLHLSPHADTEDMQITVRLVTELAPARS
jgi:type VI secretion system ImpC/EvpB family protein